MSIPPQFTPIRSREEMLDLLAEAAEIEHNLMCCYLYAAFSLKQHEDEGLSAAELAATRRWRREIIAVSVEEMAHLTMAANIMAAIGGTPHLGRPNFPIPPGYHPAGIVVKLAPFSAETLQHFIFLERPEGDSEPDGAGFDPPAQYERHQQPGRIMPNAQDYETVGQLYAAIGDGLTRLAAEMGEDKLFAGDPALQIRPEISRLPGIFAVRCLKTALAAIDAIVIQGEGAPQSSETSHFARFLAIRAEYSQLSAANPNFRPARPAAHNPLMRQRVADAQRTWISASPAAEMLDVVNAAYNHMLRLLRQVFAETRGPDAQRVLAEASTDLMYAITPIASLLTTVPAQGADLGCTAGMSFATLRAAAALPVGPATDRILIERMEEIATASATLGTAVPTLSGTAVKIRQIARDMEEGLATAGPPAITAAPAFIAAPATPPVDLRDGDGVEHAEGRQLTLHFNGSRCIHARHCVLGLPGVFKANVAGPWLDPDAAPVEELVTIAHMCPSGAIGYTRKDGGENEQEPPVNLVQLRENGPLGLRGDLHLNGAAIGMRATLCRCGASKRKPFCDSSHHDLPFVATGEPNTRPSEPLEVRGGKLDIRPEANGPLHIRGPVEICAGTGRTVDRLTSARLCRCGYSANKPFCDNSHAAIGFVAE